MKSIISSLALDRVLLLNILVSKGYQARWQKTPVFDIQALHSEQKLVSICRDSEEKRFGSPTEYAVLDILAELQI